MEYLEQHPWRKAILSNIDYLVSEEISDNNKKWEYLDGEMVKLGSLEHSLLDIKNVQDIALSLLSTDSKDLRILAHLLRTLQHSGTTLDILLALQLLYDYIDNYWKQASPKSPIKKYRLGVQILKRFESNSSSFQQNSSRIEKEAAYSLFDKLSQSLENDKLSIHIQELHILYKGNDIENKIVSTKPKETSITQDNNVLIGRASLPIIEVDASNDRAWKNTLFKVVEYLLEKDISTPVAFQLRRYAIWSNIISLPIAENNITTLLPPIPDRVAEYELAIENPTISSWMEIEHSLTVSPYWFDGHYLSAQIAKKLGYTSVAYTIKLALGEFLERLPQLKNFRFYDNTPFLSPRTLAWVEGDKDSMNISSEHSELEILQDKDFESYLETLNSQSSNDMRDTFYEQLKLAELLEKRGFQNLSKQTYLSIYKAIENIGVKEWEKSLFVLLKNRLNLSSN